MDIKASKKIKKKLGAGMLEIKQALIQFEDDYDKALAFKDKYKKRRWESRVASKGMSSYKAQKMMKQFYLK